MKSGNKKDRMRGGSAAGKVRVLLYDLETAPYLGWTWGPKWEANIIQFLSERRIISFSYKWLGDKTIHTYAIPDFPGYIPGLSRFIAHPEDNRALVLKLFALFNEADIIVAHNGINFDDRVTNTDIVRLKLTPPAPHKSVDTLRVVRSKFSFSSNSLQDVCVFLDIGKKVKHPGIEMWLGCIDGIMKFWRLMKKYNAGDIVLLEKLYLRIRPWMTNHPDMNARDRNVGCPHCRGTSMQFRGTCIAAGGRLAQRFQCQTVGCGKWSTAKLVKKQEINKGGKLAAGKLKDKEWRFA